MAKNTSNRSIEKIAKLTKEIEDLKEKIKDKQSQINILVEEKKKKDMENLWNIVEKLNLDVDEAKNLLITQAESLKTGESND